MTLDNLGEKVEKYYFKNNQWLNFETLYEDDGKLTIQEVCLVDKEKDKCIICILVRTYKDLYPSELGFQPYLKFDPEYHEYTITIPTFTYLTKEDIANALHYLERENVWLCFNIKLDGENIQNFLTRKNNNYTLDNDTLSKDREYYKGEGK
jgi:hypothetical protein